MPPSGSEVNENENVPDSVDLVGHRIFGDYEVIEKLGEGGMGAVYLARHIVIDQKIAIKVLHRDAASAEETVERFNREAHVISLLSHPNIIRVFVFGRTPDDLMYLAMEYVEGISLADYYCTYGLPDELIAIKIVKQICSAVAEAHDLSIIHRDLKPENVLLTQFRGEEHYVKILDFGIAKITEDKDQKRLTQAGIVYGTPDYLAPEQAMAKPLDNRCDLYSIGVILFEMITGHLPFEFDTVLKILQAHAFTPPPDPRDLSPQPVAETMRRIILKCLAKDPNDRFQTAMELYDALEIREREILDKRKLRRTRVPGAELTEIFAAISPIPPAFPTGAPAEFSPNQQGEAGTHPPTPPDLSTSQTMRSSAPAMAHAAPPPIKRGAELPPQQPRQPREGTPSRGRTLVSREVMAQPRDPELPIPQSRPNEGELWEEKSASTSGAFSTLSIAIIVVLALILLVLVIYLLTLIEV